MAGKGGYQKPSRPAGASAPGAGSRRTDGRVQPIREPDIDSPGMQYGDRQNLGDAQKIARIANKQGTPRPTGSAPAGPVSRKLPPWMFTGESQFPNEPGSTGLSLGAGPGPEVLMSPEAAPDVREQVLNFMATRYGNTDAAELLTQLRNERAQSPAEPSLEQPLA